MISASQISAAKAAMKDSKKRKTGEIKTAGG
jgi:hypothetical protein